MKIKAITFLDFENLINSFLPKICSLAYIDLDCQINVCQMGYIYNNGSIVLHTNTWTNKWQALFDEAKVSLCFGTDFQNDYIQLKGIIKKVYQNTGNYKYYEDLYLAAHNDSKEFSTKDGVGIILVSKLEITYCQVNNGKMIKHHI